MHSRKHTKLVHEGKYIAEVEIEIIDTEDGWSPYISLEDALRLDDIREALKAKDIETAKKMAKVFVISPVAA